MWRGRGEGWQFAASLRQAVPWDRAEAALWVPSPILLIPCPGPPGILITSPPVLPVWWTAPSSSPFVFAR